MDDPKIAYKHSLNGPVNYTWYTQLFLNQGTSYTFSTRNLSAGADPVLHVFNPVVPSQSWTNDDYAPPDRNSRIVFTAPASATC